MTARRRIVAGLGPFGLLFGCAPSTPPAPTAHKATSRTTAPLHPLTGSDETPTTTTEAPVKVATVSKLPPTTRGATTTVYRLPEAETPESDEDWWQGQPGYSGAWPALAECESGNANADTGNGYSGYFQFSDATWRSMGTGYARAVDAPYSVQLDAAQRLQARSGWGQWPACSRKLGLR